MAYSVLIVEDDPMARQLFELFVNQSTEYELQGSISSADVADIYVDMNHPDLILMDIRTSMHANGLDAAERIKRKHPEVRIIIVTSMPEYSYLKRARDIGVDSFWYKEVTDAPFYELMDRTMAGEHIFPDSTPVISLGTAMSDEFTERELEVLKLLTSGASNAVIAEHLFISEHTVKTHLQHLLEKTGYSNRTELAVRARESGIVIND